MFAGGGVFASAVFIHVDTFKGKILEVLGKIHLKLHQPGLNSNQLTAGALQCRPFLESGCAVSES